MKMLILVAALCLTACRTSADSVNGGPGRSMLGLDDGPLVADWNEWTPESTSSTPPALADASTAFDYWQVTDTVYREEVWAAVFGLLSEVRRVAPADYEQTFRMLMTVLEPGMPGGQQRLDATFFAAKPGTSPMFEGVAWRIWRELPSGATPGVTIWLRRNAAGTEEPTEAYVWFYDGFAEAKSLTLRLAGRPLWDLTLADGVALEPSTKIPGEAALLRGILLATFWKPVIGSEYLETPLEKRELTEDTPAQQPIALGMPLGDRDIDQVFSDSVFAPRLTLFPTKQQ